MDYSKYKAESAPPKPKATINSFKSFGYSLNTAVSDIIDNSISAKANIVCIEAKWDGLDSYLTITDNGDGMDILELKNAMTPGSKNPEDEREKSDLGRFGMGLKSASFSQAERLTVLTKRENTEFVHRAWYLDVMEDEWVLYNIISDEKFINNFPFTKGTTVLWEKLYELVPKEQFREDDKKIKEDFYSKITSLRRHLELTFHKYIEKKELEIILNENLIEAWNPFLSDNGTVVQEDFIGDGIDVKLHLLPHVKNIDSLEVRSNYERLDLIKYQGFYLYRNNRLITHGGWYGLFKADEFSKLARVEVNIGNQFDKQWSVDILKSRASPPIDVLAQLKVYARIARNKSAEVYRSKGRKRKIRVKKEEEYEFSPVWNAIENINENKASYSINKKHFYVKELLNKDSISSDELKKLLNLISNNIPINSILYFQNKDSNLNENFDESEVSNELVELAKEVYQHYKDKGFEHGKCLTFLLMTEPFDKMPQITELI